MAACQAKRCFYPQPGRPGNKTTKKLEFLGGDVPFKAKLAKSTYASIWSGAGIDNADHKNAIVSLQVLMPFNGKVYGATQDVKYTSKTGKTGRFKK